MSFPELVSWMVEGRDVRQVVEGQADEQGARAVADIAAPTAQRMPSWLHRRLKSLARIERRLPPHIGVELTALLFIATGAVGVLSAGRTDELVATLSQAGGLVVESVKITGQMETSEVAVLEKLQLPADASLPAIDVASARERIETLPWVQTASLRKVYPSTLNHSRSPPERQPYVLWQHDQQLQVLDETGRVIGDASDAHRSLVRVLGDGAEARAPEALALADTAPGIRARLKAAVLVGERRWNFVLDNGVTLMLPQDDPKAALARIAGFDQTDNLLGRDIVSVDLRLGDRMYVRLTPEAAARREADLKEQAKLAKRKGAST